jgi:PAS domain-containing protein
MNDLETILNNMTEAMVITNNDGDILFFNEVARQTKVVLNSPLENGRSLFDVTLVGYVFL